MVASDLANELPSSSTCLDRSKSAYTYPILKHMTRHLVLSTFSFALCFAMWGLIGAFGPIFTQTFGLSSTQAAFLVVVPVLLGSLARIPTGILADRFGGRAVFTSLMLLVAVAAAIVPLASSYETLLAGAFFLGLAGSSFRSVSVMSQVGPRRTAREAPSVFMVSARWVNPRLSSSARWSHSLSAGKPSSISAPVCFCCGVLFLRFLREMRRSENHHRVWASCWTFCGRRGWPGHSPPSIS